MRGGGAGCERRGGRGEGGGGGGGGGGAGGGGAGGGRGGGGAGGAGGRTGRHHAGGGIRADRSGVAADRGVLRPPRARRLPGVLGEGRGPAPVLAPARQVQRDRRRDAGTHPAGRP